jgi:hypothetical protein
MLYLVQGIELLGIKASLQLLADFIRVGVKRGPIFLYPKEATGATYPI